MAKLKQQRRDYMQSHSKVTRRWLNECVACHRVGYKPELPQELPGTVLAQNIQREFEPLALDDAGLCEQCADAARHSAGTAP